MSRLTARLERLEQLLTPKGKPFVFAMTRQKTMWSL